MTAAPAVGLKDRALLAALRAVPRHALSRAVGEAASWAQPAPLARLAVRGFAHRYRIDLAEAERPLSGYRTVRELFTRRLRGGARPVAAGDTVPVSPADGRIYQAGLAEAGRLVQAKGIDYTLAGLLADGRAAAAFQEGAYFAVYLSPHDYHRVHAPLGGEVTGYAYVPGELWPVNPASVATVPGLFARNERLVTYLATPVGRCAVVMVGATVVGLLRAAFDLEATAGRRARRVDYQRPRPIEKGAELGVFDMGSTVICCFEPGRVALDPALVPGAPVRVGGAVGRG
ncbi:MAG: archaetidylserine decarboxylase [Myxococcales bacterium]